MKLNIAVIFGSETVEHEVSVISAHQAMEALDPTILNSNLFPVNAKGEVRFRSVVSFGNLGRT